MQESKGTLGFKKNSTFFFFFKAYSVYGNKLPSDKNIIKSHSLWDRPLRLQYHLPSVS